jgi:hypothetical protein
VLGLQAKIWKKEEEFRKEKQESEWDRERRKHNCSSREYLFVTLIDDSV